MTKEIRLKKDQARQKNEKYCLKCESSLPLTEEFWDIKYKNYQTYYTKCKNCKKIKEKFKQDKKEQSLLGNKYCRACNDYHKKNADNWWFGKICKKLKKKKTIVKNLENSIKRRKRMKKKRQLSKTKFCSFCQQTYQKTSDHWYASANTWTCRIRTKKHCNKASIKKRRNEYQNDKYRTDPIFKFSLLLRNRYNHLLHVTKTNKKNSILDILGCSLEELKKHLEKLFKPGMNWSNHGQRGWHMDHIIPCTAFNLSDPNEMKKCFNYKNLQPLWAKDNIAKSGSNKEPYEGYYKTQIENFII